MNINEQIIRVKFNEKHVMLFGNSNKPWSVQLGEYLWLLMWNDELEYFEEVTVSDSAWVSGGGLEGLKWCLEKDFQHQLNREGCQSSEPDNPNPRQYKDMHFYSDSSVTKKVNKMLGNFPIPRSI